MDFDGDGHRDILSGSYSRDEQPMAGLFQVLRGNADGTFKKAEALVGTDGQPLVIPAEKDQVIESICTRPFAVDWDADGKLDLVVGNFAGTFCLFKGEGEGKFQPKPEQLKVGEEPLKIEGYHSDPFVIDWDGDGDLDLLSGSSGGGLQIAENRAGAGKPPQLTAFRSLIKPGGSVEDGNVLRDEDVKGPATSTRVWIDDINGDGKFDVLLGDTVSLVSPADNVSEKEFKAKHAAWQKSIAEASKELSAAQDDEEAQTKTYQRIQKLYAERSEFMKEDRTGFVWLYLQK